MTRCIPAVDRDEDLARFCADRSDFAATEFTGV